MRQTLPYILMENLLQQAPQTCRHLNYIPLPLLGKVHSPSAKNLQVVTTWAHYPLATTDTCSPKNVVMTSTRCVGQRSLSLEMKRTGNLYQWLSLSTVELVLLPLHHSQIHIYREQSRHNIILVHFCLRLAVVSFLVEMSQEKDLKK